MWRILSLRPKGVEIARKFIQIEGDSMRFVRHRRGLNEARVERDAPHQGKFGRIVKCVIKPRGLGERKPAVAVGSGQLRDDIAGVAKNRLSAGMTVLNVEH